MPLMGEPEGGPVHEGGAGHGRLVGGDAVRALVPVERIGGKADEVDVESTQPEANGEIDPNHAVPVHLTDEERGARLAALTSIIELMRPAVQADGGDLALISADVVTGVVEVQLQGACSSCAVSSSTLQGGVERILHDRLDWVTEVLGGVDESVDPFLSESMGRGGYVPSF
jgi:Fe-S cluster biogenesis protein NfuA